MKLYRIANWNENFENNRTRELDAMKWVPIPNKHDGEGFADLLSRENGMALYGAWILILQVASKCDQRGTLLRTTTGTPHTAETIARQSRGDSVMIAQSMSILVEIGWLTVEEWKSEDGKELHETAPACDQVPTEVRANDYGKEGKGKEEKGKEQQPSAPRHDFVSEFKKLWQELPKPFPKVSVWTEARLRSLKSRLCDQWWLDNYKEALIRMQNSDFCKGVNDQTWIADLEFFLRPESVPKIMEGKYDARVAPNAKPRSPQSPQVVTDPEASKAALDRYRKSFKRPPVDVKVGGLLDIPERTEVPT